MNYRLLMTPRCFAPPLRRNELNLPIDDAQFNQPNPYAHYVNRLDVHRSTTTTAHVGANLKTTNNTCLRPFKPYSWTSQTQISLPRRGRKKSLLKTLTRKEIPPKRYRINTSREHFEVDPNKGVLRTPPRSLNNWFRWWGKHDKDIFR